MKLVGGRSNSFYDELGKQEKFLLGVADERSRSQRLFRPRFHSACIFVAKLRRFVSRDTTYTSGNRSAADARAHTPRDETRHRLTGKIRDRGRIGRGSLSWWSRTHLRIPSTVIHVVIVDRTHGPWRGPNSIFSYSNPLVRTARCVRPIFAPRFTRSRPGAPYRFYRFA